MLSAAWQLVAHAANLIASRWSARLMLRCGLSAEPNMENSTICILHYVIVRVSTALATKMTGLAITSAKIVYIATLHR
jgi:hypothetical protein